MRPRLTYANVMATVAVFIALGGASYAAFKLPKNSVGARQLKKNSVTAKKIKKNAVTRAKIRKNAVTGAKVNEATLGTVPAAQAAATANTANVANSLAPAEGWHEVGAAGEPAFENGWVNVAASLGSFPEHVAFFKDHEGVVHLRGEAISGSSATSIFRLPPGYRPAGGRFIRESVACEGPGCPDSLGTVVILGPNQALGGSEDEVIPPLEATHVWLDGITFRAES